VFFVTGCHQNKQELPVHLNTIAKEIAFHERIYQVAQASAARNSYLNPPFFYDDVRGTVDVPVYPYPYKGSDGFLRWSDDNSRCVLVELNSPENRMAILRDNPEKFFDDLNFYAKNGVNTIYFTVFGDDDTSIFLSEGDIIAWRMALAYWAYAVNREQGRPGIGHVVLGEAENHHLLTDSERAALFMRAMRLMRDLPAIFLLGEEITQSMNGVQVGLPYIRRWCTFIRNESPTYYGRSALISLHNELHWRPWNSMVGEGLFDMVAFQGRVE